MNDAVSPVRRRGLRLTTRVFWDLAVYAIGMGLAVGMVFPPFAVVLGVPEQYAARLSFRVACLVAGVLVGAASYALCRAVVGRRLAELSRHLRSVAHEVTRTRRTGEWCRPSERIRVDSDDELGETTRAFNDLLDALDAGEHFRALVRNASDVITVVDAEGTVTYQTPSVGWVLGHPPAALLGSRVLDLVHPDDAAAFQDHLAATVSQTGQTAPLRSRLRHRDGSWRSVETVTSDLRADPAVNGIVLTTRDVGEREQLEQQLRRQAFHDPLTGLPNRALFMERLRAAEALEQRDGTPSTVLFLDLDDLKTVNDGQGHESGDALLQVVAARVLGCLRPEDTLARLSGDEFAVLLVGTHTDAHAVSVAERVLASLRQPVVVGDATLSSGASMGIATSTTAAASGIGVLRAADVAMYVAKTGGKGRYEVFRPSHHAARLDREALQADLARALEADQFLLHYQPVVGLTSEDVVGFEALLRWDHPTRGLVPPGAFIDIAEESGLIVPIGRWVLREATGQAARWRASGAHPDVYVAVNVSVRQFQHPGLVADVIEALRESRLAPGQLTVEITESLFAGDTASTIGKLEELKALGVRLALDDFGTGYSSLSYLRRFPIDVLKIDKSFVDGLGSSAEDWAVTSAIVALGQILHLTVVAEGIETAAELAALRLMGVHCGQGYHLGRPAPAAAWDAGTGAVDRRRADSPGTPLRAALPPSPHAATDVRPA